MPPPVGGGYPSQPPQQSYGAPPTGGYPGYGQQPPQQPQQPGGMLTHVHTFSLLHVYSSSMYRNLSPLIACTSIIELFSKVDMITVLFLFCTETGITSN